MDLDPSSFGTMPPKEFAALVKSLKDKEINELMGGDLRDQILDAIFARFPEQFRPEKAGDKTARINFRITGGPGGSSDTYAIVVDQGTCAIEKHPETEPSVSIMTAPAEFARLITATGNPVMMFMTGKVKARGDLSLATALQTWFDLPRA